MFKNSILFICLLISPEITAQLYPPGFSQVLVTGSISNPTVMAFAPDGRIFVAEQGGRLMVIKENVLLPTPFVTLTVSSSGERGLIGMAFDPDFSTNHYIYLYYTVPGSPPAAPHNRISRFTADGDVAVTGSEFIILELDDLSAATNHNGGALAFGPDGKLYVAVGENANSAHAQNLDTYHGKILRINRDGSAPADNPFIAGATEQRKRVWAYGLRNPYTIAFQPGTGRFFVNDVGQGTWEEINDATTGGKNFGWPQAEGNSSNPAFTNPVYAYGHGSVDGLGCAITGGTFFNPTTTNYPSRYYGKYFFQDLCSRWINELTLDDPATRSSYATEIPGNALSLMTGPDGNLYFLSRSSGALYKIIYVDTSAPLITDQPDNVSVMQGEPASFTVSAVGSTPLSYQWQKNTSNIPGATSATYTINSAVPADAGNYRVVVSNVAGNVTSNVAVLTVTAVNAKPQVDLTTPAAGTLYVAGTAIPYSATGTDAEDGTLPASAFSWNINFHHDTHVHDQPAIVGVKSGTFDIPNEGETSDNVWYRIIVTVTDSEGLKAKDSVDIHPRKSTINLATIPAGLQVTLDGQPLNTPFSIVSVEGMHRTIGIVTPQELGDESYDFVSWAHGGASTQTITTPADDVTYTANFSLVVGVEESLFSDQDMSVFPNPSKGNQITVGINSPRDQQAGLALKDILSRNVHQQNVSLHPGENNVTMMLEHVPPGMYTILLQSGGANVSKKLVISK